MTKVIEFLYVRIASSIVCIVNGRVDIIYFELQNIDDAEYINYYNRYGYTTIYPTSIKCHTYVIIHNEEYMPNGKILKNFIKNEKKNIFNQFKKILEENLKNHFHHSRMYKKNMLKVDNELIDYDDFEAFFYKNQPKSMLTYYSTDYLYEFSPIDEGKYVKETKDGRTVWRESNDYFRRGILSVVL